MTPIDQPAASAAAGNAIAHRQHQEESTHMTHAIAIAADSALPPDVEAMRERLREVQRDVTEIRRQADGLILGKIGLDGLIGLIPGVGGAYSAYGGLRLLIQAIRAKCSVSTILSGVALVLADIVIGVFVGVGDVADFFFRSHAWFAGMILSEVEAKLAYVERTEHALTLTHGEEHTRRLQLVRDQLFRGGKSEKAVYLRLAVIAAACLFLVHECRRAEEARQETIRACVANGGWFCSARH